MVRRIGVSLVGAVLAASALVPADAMTAISARDVPRLVEKARDGDTAAARRLDVWIANARSGDPAALTVVAQVLNDGIVADAPRVYAVEHQAAHGGWDARTDYLRAILAGEARITVAKAIDALALTEGMSAVDAAEGLADVLDTSLGGRVVRPQFSPAEPDPEDAFALVEADSAVEIAGGGARTECAIVEYRDELDLLTLMGMKVCISWTYDGERYVGQASRSIDPYVSLTGTARGWRWVGAPLAERYYYNYKRKGPKSGYHTRTIGHFQHCLSQVVLAVCDQDLFPMIELNGHFDGSFSRVAKP